jgi:hypothetical protein
MEAHVLEFQICLTYAMAANFSSWVQSKVHTVSVLVGAAASVVAAAAAAASSFFLLLSLFFLGAMLLDCCLMLWILGSLMLDA